MLQELTLEQRQASEEVLAKYTDIDTSLAKYLSVISYDYFMLGVIYDNKQVVGFRLYDMRFDTALDYTLDSIAQRLLEKSVVIRNLGIFKASDATLKAAFGHHKTLDTGIAIPNMPDYKLMCTQGIMSEYTCFDINGNVISKHTPLVLIARFVDLYGYYIFADYKGNTYVCDSDCAHKPSSLSLYSTLSKGYADLKHPLADNGYTLQWALTLGVANCYAAILDGIIAPRKESTSVTAVLTIRLYDYHSVNDDAYAYMRENWNGDLRYMKAKTLCSTSKSKDGFSTTFFANSMIKPIPPDTLLPKPNTSYCKDSYIVSVMVNNSLLDSQSEKDWTAFMHITEAKLRDCFTLAKADELAYENVILIPRAIMYNADIQAYSPYVIPLFSNTLSLGTSCKQQWRALTQPTKLGRRLGTDTNNLYPIYAEPTDSSYQYTDGIESHSFAYKADLPELKYARENISGSWRKYANLSLLAPSLRCFNLNAVPYEEEDELRDKIPFIPLAYLKHKQVMMDVKNLSALQQMGSVQDDTAEDPIMNLYVQAGFYTTQRSESITQSNYRVLPAYTRVFPLTEAGIVFKPNPNVIQHIAPIDQKYVVEGETRGFMLLNVCRGSDASSSSYTNVNASNSFRKKRLFYSDYSLKSNVEELTQPIKKVSLQYTTPFGMFYARGDVHKYLAVTLQGELELLSGRSFEYQDKMKSCDLSKTNIRVIGMRAFSGCLNLSNLLLPDTVKEIHAFAFSECPMLESITLPEGLEEIGENAFIYCESLKSIVIPKTVKRIHAKAFAYCDNLETVVIRNPNTQIEETAFYSCNPDVVLSVSKNPSFKKNTYINTLMKS